MELSQWLVPVFDLGGVLKNVLTEICLHCGTRVAKESEKELEWGISPKSRLATTLLAWFLGVFGAHRFYVGETGTAIIMLLLIIMGAAITRSWFFVSLFGFYVLLILIAVVIWALVDFIVAVTGHMKDAEGGLIQKW